MFAKHELRAMLTDEGEKVGGEVSIIVCAFLGSGGGERLAWGGAGPHAREVRDAREAERHGPKPDPREGVELPHAPEIVRADLRDAPIVHAPGGDPPRRREVPEPPRRVRIDLVVENHPRISVWQSPLASLWRPTKRRSTAGAAPR